MGQRTRTEEQAARVAARRHPAGIDLLAPRVVRPRLPIRSETRFHYDGFVAIGVVDRAEWAKVVQEILDLEAQPTEPGGKMRTHGAKTRFAARVGVAVRTLDSWLRMENEVKESSVRQVAEAYVLNAVQILVRVGVYAPEQLPVRPTDEQIDDEQRTVLDLDIDDETKALILEALEEMRVDDERILAEQRERDRKRRHQRITEMVARAKARAEQRS